MVQGRSGDRSHVLERHRLSRLCFNVLLSLTDDALMAAPLCVPMCAALGRLITQRTIPISAIGDGARWGGERGGHEAHRLIIVARCFL